MQKFKPKNIPCVEADLQNFKSNNSLCAEAESKKISNDQELIQSDPISCPQNQKGNIVTKYIN